MTNSVVEQSVNDMFQTFRAETGASKMSAAKTAVQQSFYKEDSAPNRTNDFKQTLKGEKTNYLASNFYRVEEPVKQLVTASKHLVDQLLELNTCNRKLDRKAISYLQSEINIGKWKEVGDIIVSKNGVLLDGQHRLTALAEAGYPPLKFWLYYGVEDNYREAIDQGKRRTVKDILAIQDGIKVNKFLFASINFLQKINPKTLQRIHEGNVIPISTPRMRGLYKDLSSHADISALDFFNSKNHALRVAPIAAALYQYSIINPEGAKILADAMAVGSGLDLDSPVLNFRNAVFSQPGLKKANKSGTLYRKAVAAILGEHDGKKCGRALPEVNGWGKLSDQIWFPTKVE